MPPRKRSYSSARDLAPSSKRRMPFSFHPDAPIPASPHQLSTVPSASPPSESRGSTPDHSPDPNEQPPLPDEEPPISDEQSPLPDEEPPLPDEEPPLPDEEPPLPDEEPPLPDEEPPLPDEESPLSGEEPEVPGDELHPSVGSGGEAPASAPPSQAAGQAAAAAGWQAVWDPSAQAYYYWNARTGETTWTFPGLSISAEEGSNIASGSAAASGGAASAEVDPDLAYLDPGTYDPALAASRGAAAYGALWARTQAAGPEGPKDAMENDYVYDTQQLAQPAREEVPGAADAHAVQRSAHAAHRHPTKKEVRAFTMRKKARKAANQAWLRD